MSLSPDGVRLLQQADTAAEAGDRATSGLMLMQARLAFSRAGDLAGLAAVMRREALNLDESRRLTVLRDAVRLARQAGDRVGEAEGLDDLARLHVEAGRLGPAVALFGEVAKVHATREDLAGELRALQMAGQLLCEGWGSDRDPTSGVLMLLWAAERGRRLDESLADMVENYITGYQYTLSDAEFSLIEARLNENRQTLILGVFAQYRGRWPDEIP